MDLRKAGLPLFLNTSESDVISDFFIPALQNSNHYDRGVGFFSSGWLKIAARGMTEFAQNEGRARWVISPILDEKDWQAMIEGEKAKHDPDLYKILNKNIDNLEIYLDKSTLSALAWMIADDIIEFRIALPRNKLDKGIFHDKFGIFCDSFGNKVSFNGSYNDSIQGTRNYESIKVFNSWNDDLSLFVESDVNRFEVLWEDKEPNVKVYSLPESNKKRIIKLRENRRPYHPLDPKFPVSDINSLTPSVPNSIKLRNYQIEAINMFKSKGGVGIFEMATGTGKTITSLAASIEYFNIFDKIALVITCPYVHLVEQWKTNAEIFGYRPILAFKNSETWKDNLHNKIISYNHQDIKNLCVIATHSTFSTNTFQRLIAEIDNPCFLIADEVHHLGANNSSLYFPKNIKLKLGLSATPERWYDEEGSQKINDYFGETIFEFNIGDAISNGFLTKYYYFPIITTLTDDEMTEYVELSAKISKIYFINKPEDENDALLKLLIKRANILNNAKNKINKLNDLINYRDEISHALFYCAPKQRKDVIHLLGNEKKIKVHQFTYRETNEIRQKLLKEFDCGLLQGLVAIKCLDEGVDVPSTTTAYILASSSNPREFIQRRGRILRNHPGKNIAYIYDLITFPPEILVNNDIERKLVRKELLRFREFAQYAMNFNSAYNTIWELAKNFDIFDF